MAFIFTTMNTHKLVNFVELAIRINIFLKLVSYGLGKIMNGQFYLKGQLPSEVANLPLREVDGYTLAWTFFGYSKGYILFIGIAQLVGAILFLINRTKIIGGFILLPILMNIIIMDYFYGVAYGALFSALFYALGILWVCSRNWIKIKKSLVGLLVDLKIKITQKEIPYYLIAIALVFIIFVIEYYGIQLFGYEDRVV